MVKSKMVYALTAAALMAGTGVFVPGVWAESSYTTLTSCEDIEKCAIVTSTSELSTALATEDSTIIVGSSFDLTADLKPYYDFTLYLNDYTITSDGYSFIPHGTMTVYAGENGVIKEISGDWAPFYVHGGLVLKSGTINAAELAVYVLDDGASFVMDGGTITSGGSAVVVDDGASFTMNDGTISAPDWTVSVFDNSSFVMNNGTVSATGDSSIAIGGNGTNDPKNNNYGVNAKITINGGTVTAGELGIYAPQISGVTTIAGGTINALTGVEVRAGELNITGGKINVPSDTEYEVVANGNGSTTIGAAIAVAQHTTKQPITVNVSGGTFKAPVVFSQANPQKNSEEDIAKISLSVTGGKFTGDIVSENFEKDTFVTGGTFTNEILDDGIAIEIEGALVAKSELQLAIEDIAIEGLTLAESDDETALIAVANIKLVDENGEVVTVSKEDDVSLTIRALISDEQYAELSQYDKVVVIYFDENGVEQEERIDATMEQREDGAWEVVFTTNHLSTYGVAGVNTAEQSSAGTPETGTVTREGASAISAAILTAVAVGLLVAIITFAFFIRRI